MDEPVEQMEIPGTLDPDSLHDDESSGTVPSRKR